MPRILVSLFLLGIALLFVINSCNIKNPVEAKEDCPKYNREEYGTWKDGDGDCQNTRAEVLIEESLIPVSYKSPRDCKVTAGEWYDPYYNITLYIASKVDVDHFVPLAEAHRSGGYGWTKAKKQKYANDVLDSNHLIAVSASANRSKSDRDPGEWLPKNTRFIKEYALRWVQIKRKWNLTANREELSVLRRILGNSVKYPAEAVEAYCKEAG